MESEEDAIKFAKKMNLQKGHYYIILTDVGDDKFKMSAYDTTEKQYKSEADHSVGSIIHEGLVGLLWVRVKKYLTLVHQNLHTTTYLNECLVRCLTRKARQ